MAGSIMVRYARKTSKQLAKERSGSHAQMKNINYSIDIDPESISYMTFETQSEAKAFVEPLKGVLDVIGWETERKSSLDNFFI